MRQNEMNRTGCPKPAEIIHDLPSEASLTKRDFIVAGSARKQKESDEKSPVKKKKKPQTKEEKAARAAARAKRKADKEARRKRQWASAAKGAA